jgi:hypothetical protein
MMKGILVVAMYIPPTASVISPTNGPASMPDRNIGNWEKWIANSKGSITMGTASGGMEITLANAAMMAANISILIPFNIEL